MSHTPHEPINHSSIAEKIGECGVFYYSLVFTPTCITSPGWGRLLTNSAISSMLF